jgi:hypothetical protein
MLSTTRGKADSVAEEADRPRPELVGEGAVDGGEGRTHDGQARGSRHAPPAHELHGYPEALHLLGDLRACAVDDADLVAGVSERQDRGGRSAHDAASAFDDDAVHER